MRKSLLAKTHRLCIISVIIIIFTGCYSPDTKYRGKTPQEVYKEADFLGFFEDGLGFVIKFIPVSTDPVEDDYMLFWIVNYGNKPFELNYLSKVAYYIGKKKYYPDNFDSALKTSGNRKFINPGSYFFNAYSIDGITIPKSVTSKITAISIESSVIGKKEYVASRRINVEDKGYPRAKSLFNYNTTNPNHLSFKKGDIFTIISTKYKDKGWLWCELNGKQGFVHGNYIKEIK